MAKGLEKHQERLNQLNMLGRDLARRARSRCELCGASGTALSIHEVPPVPTEPDPDQCLFLCATCSGGMEKLSRSDFNHWRNLGDALWSETPAAQVMAVRILRALEPQCDWIPPMLEHLYLEPEVEEWIARAPVN